MCVVCWRTASGKWSREFEASSRACYSLRIEGVSATTHLAPWSPDHQFQQRLGNVGLQAFGVALVQPHHVGDRPGVRIDELQALRAAFW
jgi:hypothetical protein